MTQKLELRAIDDGLAVVSNIDSSGWCLNTILLRCPKGLLAYSPTKDLGDGIHEQIRAFGSPKFLVAPNHFHHLGLVEWSSRYPDAVVVAGERATPRLRRQRPSTDFRSLDEVELPTDASWLVPAGTRNGEVWIATPTTWIVCDAFFNLEPPLTGLRGLLLRAFSVGPGLRIGGTWKLLHFGVRDVYRASLLEALERHPPSRLVLSHGAVAEGSDLAARLAREAD